MAGAAIESPLLKAAFAGRNSSQSYPVFADETHWPFNKDDIRIAQPPLKPIWVSAGVGLSGSRLSAKIWHDRQCAKELRRIRFTGPGGTWPARPSALKALVLGPGRASEGSSSALSSAHWGTPPARLRVTTSNHPERGVRVVWLLKPTDDAVRSASASRQGISCTIGGKSG